MKGDWGIRNSKKAGELGLPARKDISDSLEFEGMNLIRMGGSMCNQNGYRWKYFRGPRQFRVELLLSLCVCVCVCVMHSLSLCVF